jgi:hypothetical protein
MNREMRCATCRHWDGPKTCDIPNHDPVFGDCGHPQIVNYIAGWEVDGFTPPPQFGCTLHEAAS